MSTIGTNAEDLILNADGSGSDIKFKSNGVEKASISNAGLFTSTTIDATKLTGNLPAISAANLTAIPAANITGTLPAISGANLTGLSSGLSEVDQWRMTTDLGCNGVCQITANWERVDTGGFEKIGTGITESSGIFTFPSTGKWLINYHMRCNQVTGAVRYAFFSIDTSVDTGSNWVGSAGSGVCIPDAASGTDYASSSVFHLFDVTNTSTHQVRVNVTTSAYAVIDGNTGSSETSILFQKLGDT
jgi:hypothetical protein